MEYKNPVLIVICYRSAIKRFHGKRLNHIKATLKKAPAAGEEINKFEYRAIIKYRTEKGYEIRRLATIWSIRSMMLDDFFYVRKW